MRISETQIGISFLVSILAVSLGMNVQLAYREAPKHAPAEDEVALAAAEYRNLLEEYGTKWTADYAFHEQLLRSDKEKWLQLDPEVRQEAALRVARIKPVKTESKLNESEVMLALEELKNIHVCSVAEIPNLHKDWTLDSMHKLKDFLLVREDMWVKRFSQAVRDEAALRWKALPKEEQ